MQRARNLFLGLVPLAVSIVLLLLALDTMEPGLEDLIQRAWPALLVFIGLLLTLRDRIPFGSIFALAGSIILVAGVTFFAYSIRESEQRTDQVVTINEAFDDQTALLALNILTLQTDIDIRTTEASRTLTGEFIGSTESEVVFTCLTSDANITECTFTEDRPSQFPLLEAVGRGALSLQVPADMPITLAFAGDDGNATFDMSGTQLERISIDLNGGDVVINVPEYEPQSPNAPEAVGQLAVNNGNLTLLVPATANVRVRFDRRGGSIAPEFPPTYIEQRDGVDGVLRRDNEDGQFNLIFDAVVPSGLIRLEVRGNDSNE